MSFDQIERSNYDSIPTKLYEFTLASRTWRYASGEQNVAHNGAVYLGIPISDSGMSQSGEIDGDDFTVTLPASAEFTQLFRGTPPSQFIRVLVRQANRGEEDAPIIWAGLVKNGRRTNVAEFQVTCRLLTASLNRLGVRLAWARGCHHALYDRRCRVDKQLFAVVAQISGVDGSGFSAPVSSLGRDYLTGGFIEFNGVGGVLDRRAIESHEGTRIVLLGSADGLTNGMSVTLYPGCDRTSSTCELKFNNLSNYGGFDRMPKKSPFDGDPVF